MAQDVEVTFDPPDLLRRMNAYPRKMDEEMRGGMNEAKYHVTGSVPPYPVAPAGVDTSGRTGQLGRTMGSGTGRAQIFTTRKLGQGAYEAEVGTNLWYAARVIGENQLRPWAEYWWNIQTVARRAKDGIIRIFNGVADKMAAFLEGRG